MSPTLAVFGATGDSAGYCLAAALNAGLSCRALARDPAKLTSSIKAKGVSAATLDKLTIIPGHIRDVEAVKQTLRLPSGRVVDRLVSRIGGTLVFQWSLFRPFTLADPTICQSAGATILQALQELHADNEPIFINISTTGIQAKGMPRDLPLAMLPMYHYMLAVPHEDKRVLEEMLAAHVALPESERGLSAYINVRPSLLVDGNGLGIDKVRQGSDQDPAVGYTIQRRDVGDWVFERLVKPKHIDPTWINNGITLIY